MVGMPVTLPSHCVAASIGNAALANLPSPPDHQAWTFTLTCPTLPETVYYDTRPEYKEGVCVFYRWHLIMFHNTPAITRISVDNYGGITRFYAQPAGNKCPDNYDTGQYASSYKIYEHEYKKIVELVYSSSRKKWNANIADAHITHLFRRPGPFPYFRYYEVTFSDKGSGHLVASVVRIPFDFYFVTSSSLAMY